MESANSVSVSNLMPLTLLPAEPVKTNGEISNASDAMTDTRFLKMDRLVLKSVKELSMTSSVSNAQLTVLKEIHAHWTNLERPQLGFVLPVLQELDSMRRLELGVLPLAHHTLTLTKTQLIVFLAELIASIAQIQENVTCVKKTQPLLSELQTVFQTVLQELTLTEKESSLPVNHATKTVLSALDHSRMTVPYVMEILRSTTKNLLS